MKSIPLPAAPDLLTARAGASVPFAQKTSPKLRSLGTRLLRSVTTCLARRLWVGRVVGRRHVPSQGPCIIIANHSSYLDFLVLSALFEVDLGRLLRFWASERITRHWFFRHYCERAGCLEVGQEKIAKTTWQRSIQGLTQRGDFLCIFPEGTRTRTGQLQDFKPGYLRLAAAANAPVLPVRLEHSFEAWSPHRRLPRWHRINIEFHEPVRVAAGLSPAALRQLNDSLRARCDRAG